MTNNNNCLGHIRTTKRTTEYFFSNVDFHRTFASSMYVISTHIYSGCFSSRVVNSATDTVELCERNNISIMKRISRGNGKVWSHPVNVHDLRHQFGIRFRAERKFSTDAPHLYAKYQPEYNVFLVRRFKQKCKKKKEKKKCCGKSIYKNITRRLRDSIQNSLTSMVMLMTMIRAKGMATPHDQVNSIEWNSL